RDALAARDAVAVERALERGAVGDVAEEQVLLRRHAQAQALLGDRLADRAAQRRAHAPVLDGEAVEMAPVLPRLPAEEEPQRRQRHRRRVLEVDAEAAAQLGLHLVDAEPADRVLPARLPAVAPLAVLLLEDRDRARRSDHLRPGDAAEMEAEQG